MGKLVIVQAKGGARPGVFAATNSGIWRRMGPGVWSLMLAGNYSQIISPFGSPNVLYACLSGFQNWLSGITTGILARSDDNGITWTDLSAHLPTPGQDQFLWFSVADGDGSRLYGSMWGFPAIGGLDASGLYESTDGGMSWSLVDVTDLTYSGSDSRDFSNDVTDGAVAYIQAHTNIALPALWSSRPFTALFDDGNGSGTPASLMSGARTVRGTSLAYTWGNPSGETLLGQFDFSSPGTRLAVLDPVLAGFITPSISWIEPLDATSFLASVIDLSGSGSRWALLHGMTASSWTLLLSSSSADHLHLTCARLVVFEPAHPLRGWATDGAGTRMWATTDGGVTWTSETVTTGWGNVIDTDHIFALCATG